MDNYVVRSYHFNVQAGDSAVHTLVQLNTKKIISAVLVDGGKGGESNIQPLKTFFDTKKLKLDAVIVTHWDSDHYIGIYKLLELDYEDQSQPDDWQPNLFKFDGDDPVTRFYCPYFGDTKPPRVTDLKPSYTKFSTNKKGNQLNIALDGAKFENIAILYSNPVIGTDFFNPDDIQPTPAQANSFNTPKKLYQWHLNKSWHKTTHSGAPGLYCVAQNWTCIGGFPTPGGPKLDVDVTVDIEGDKPAVLDTQDSTPTNQSSMAAMLIWDDGAISLYTAGDRDDPREIPIVNWSGCTGGPKLGANVTTVKASHHGACTSSPRAFFDNFNPQNVVISSGADYGHPQAEGWEFLMYIQAWNKLNSVKLRSTKGEYRDFQHPLVSTVFPYWLAMNGGQWVELSANKMSTVAFDDDKFLPFQQAIMSKYDEVNRLSKAKIGKRKAIEIDPVSEYEKDDLGTRSEKLQWISGMLAPFWKKLSLVGTEAYPEMTSKGWVYGTTVQAVGRRPTSISWIRVNHTHPWYQDGDLYVRYDSGTEELFRKNSDNTAPTTVAEADATVVPAATITTPGDDDTDRFPIPQPRARGIFPNAGSVQLTDDIYDDPNIDPDEQSNPGPGSGIKPNPPPTPAYPSVQWPAGQYFYSARVQPGPSGAGITAQECGVDSDFGYLLPALHTGLIGLSATADAGGQWYTVLDDGDLQEWFGAALGMRPGDMKAATDNPSAPTKLSDLQITLSASSTFSGGDLVFNFGSVAVAFQQQPGDIIAFPGVIVDRKMTILGLDPRNGAKVTTTTEYLFQYISLQRYAKMKVIGSMGLTLDSSQSTGQRNAIWFVPGEEYATMFRTVWTVSTGIQQLNDFLAGFNLGIRVTAAEVIAFKRVTWDATLSTTSPALGASSPSTGTTADEDDEENDDPGVIPVRYNGSYAAIGLAVAIKGVTLRAYMMLKQFSTELTVICDNGPSLADLVDWVLAAFTGGAEKPSGTDVTSWMAQIGSSIRPRRLRVLLDEGDSLSFCEVAFEIDLSIGHDPSVPGNVASLFSFCWSVESGMTLAGSFFPHAPPLLFEKVLVPGYEDYEDLQPDATNAVDEIRLATLIPKVTVDEIPGPLDLAIKAASFSVSTGGDLGFLAVITTSDDAVPPNLTVPHLRLGLLSLGASYSESAGLNLSCSLSVSLTGKDGDSSSKEAMLIGSLIYMKTAKAQKRAQKRRLPRDSDKNASWQVSAHIQDLQVGTLFELFDADSQDGVLGLVGHVDIASLDLLYNYSAGTASDFTFTGTLLLGPFELDLEYHYPADKQWYFHANLGIGQGTGSSMTLQELVTSLHNTSTGNSVDDSGVVNLPDFVGNIVVSGGNVSLDILVKSSTIGGDVPTPAVFCVVDLKIADFQVMFVQFQEGKAGSSTTASAPKRLFRAALTALPEVGDIPIIGNITQPFDEMYFLYAAVGGGSAGAAVQGVTRAELAAVNAVLPADAPPLVVQETRAKPQLTDVLITPGAHFVVAVNSQDNVPVAILDYGFDPDKKPPTEIMVTGLVAAPPEDDDSPDDNSGKASLKKTIGPLTLDNIGLQYKDGQLGILLDATLKMGPIELELLGFSLMVPLQGNVINSIIEPSVSISGLSVSFNEPPTSMAGMFAQLGKDLYAGGLSVTLDPYVLTAAGAYGTVTDPASKDAYKTVAVFAQCQGPLVELEFAQIAGVCLGFGYNSHLTLPTVDNVTSFPLVENNTQVAPGQSAIDIFNGFQQPPGGDPSKAVWIVPRQDSIWLAAGMEVTALSVLSVNAVVVVDFDPDVKLGVYADAVGSFPSEASGDKFVYVELGIAGSVDFAVGSMVVQAKLAPTSYILDPSCHLTGGFALCYWFGSNAHAGDWVFTIGGYHPAYQPPPHYPVPDRLAISWTLDDSLSVLGDAYCAVTPKACMAGGALHVALSLGPLSASFSAWADFLLNFEPFWFEGDGGVSVHVEFTLDLWIVTIHIDVEIGASLHLQGPSTAGTVHVDFWVFGFDVDFGSSGDKPTQPLSLQDFYTHILLPGTAQATGNGNASEGDTTNQHTVTCKKGLVADKGVGDPKTPPSGQSQWKVRGGGMAFAIKSVFAFSQAAVTQGGQVKDVSEGIFSRPMHRTKEEGPLDTAITILVYVKDDTTKTPIEGFRIAEDPAELPTAVWGDYTTDTDPIVSGNQIKTLLNGSDNPTVRLMNGVTVTAPKPSYSTDMIPPFNVLIANIAHENKDHEFKEYNVAPSSDRWNPDPPKEEQYALVESTWPSPAAGVDAAHKAADLWASRMWTGPGGQQPLPPLEGAPPRGLLVKEVFELDYLAAPMVSVVVAE